MAYFNLCLLLPEQPQELRNKIKNAGVFHFRFPLEKPNREGCFENGSGLEDNIEISAFEALETRCFQLLPENMKLAHIIQNYYYEHRATTSMRNHGIVVDGLQTIMKTPPDENS
ncbi:891_t:CDS:2, partial [Paraglomus brasilianum]